MNIKLELVPAGQKEQLGNLIKDYQREILNSGDVNEYKYLDSYWEKSDRHPYFVKVDGKIVGFVLINSHNLIGKDAKNIAEFYIEKEFRNKGIGGIAAIKSFELFPGKWEVRELSENTLASNFWRKVIGEYTHGNYSEIKLDNDEWRGYIQTFSN
jgi:predicted acetyltransferase